MAVRDTKSQFPKLAYTRNTPDNVRAVMSKLVTEPGKGNAGRRGDQKQVRVSRDMFERLSRQTAQDSIDASSVFQLLPDTELAEQILVGSILSPKDMSTVDLNFTVANPEFDSEISRPMLAVFEQHFKHDYKIDDRLDLQLEEILFTKGAHILAVLPENNLDVIINGNTSRKLSMEHFHQAVGRIRDGRPMGLLGHPRQAQVSMETFRDRTGTADKIQVALKGGKGSPFEMPGIQVTDNFDVLKTPAIYRRARERSIADKLNRHNVSMEAATQGLTPEQIDQLYQPRGQGGQPTQVVTSQTYMDRPTVGHPLVLKLPIESVIPVHVPGQPDEHIGYFVMIDRNGRPVVRDEDRDYYGELRSNFTSNSKDSSSELVRRTKEAMGAAQQENGLEFDQIHEAYSTIIENDLLNRLRNGIYGEDFELGFTEDVYRIMLYRSLKAQQTQLLYIPVELVTYMAFSYNGNGIGTTLLTQSKILASMRSVLLFADTMAGVRNAIGRKRASISVDGDDQDPEKTISDIQTAILEGAHRGFPLGSPDPGMTLDYLNRAGFDFSINVESDHYPNTKVEFDDHTSNSQAGNPELQDRLRRMHISGMGINPELVDPTSSPDFAVSVVNNNLMMTRRVMRYQKLFTAFQTKFVQTYARHSSILRERLLAVVVEQKKLLSPEQRKKEPVEIVDEFIDAIETILPAPDTTRIEQQAQAFQNYSSLLDQALDAYITADLFPAEILARDSSIVDHTIAVIKAYYLRLWLNRNNVMPELDALIEMDGKKPVFSLLDVQEGQIGSLGSAIQEYIDGVLKLKEKWEKQNAESESDKPELEQDPEPAVADEPESLEDDNLFAETISDEPELESEEEAELNADAEQETPESEEVDSDAEDEEEPKL
jgi:hypothetical protein